MPELPEVETVRRGLEPVLVGARIEDADTRRPDLRFPFPERFAERLTGRRVEGLRRRAKYILADLDGGEVWVTHLGMSGSFRIGRLGEAEATPGEFEQQRSKNVAHDHLALRLDSGATVTFNDPRRFGYMALIPAAELAAHPLFRQLGLDALDEAPDGARLAEVFAGRRAPLKAALLDQRLVAGLGNIYVSEALHRARLSPERAAGTLAGRGGKARAMRLAQSIRSVLLEAIEAGGSSLRDHVGADGELGYFQHRFRVYDREGAACPTPGCRGVIRRIVQGGRSTFFCPRCQK
jgi:formamidopyrimidine-DNA glycosylase